MPVYCFVCLVLQVVLVVYIDLLLCGRNLGIVV